MSTDEPHIQNEGPVQGQNIGGTQQITQYFYGVGSETTSSAIRTMLLKSVLVVLMIAFLISVTLVIMILTQQNKGDINSSNVSGNTSQSNTYGNNDISAQGGNTNQSNIYGDNSATVGDTKENNSAKGNIDIGKLTIWFSIIVGIFIIIGVIAAIWPAIVGQKTLAGLMGDCIQKIGNRKSTKLKAICILLGIIFLPYPLLLSIHPLANNQSRSIRPTTMPSTMSTPSDKPTLTEIDTVTENANLACIKCTQPQITATLPSLTFVPGDSAAGTSTRIVLHGTFPAHLKLRMISISFVDSSGNIYGADANDINEQLSFYDKIPQADLYNIFSVEFQARFHFLSSKNTNYTLNMTLSINDTSTNQYQSTPLFIPPITPSTARTPSDKPILTEDMVTENANLACIKCTQPQITATLPSLTFMPGDSATGTSTRIVLHGTFPAHLKLRMISISFVDSPDNIYGADTNNINEQLSFYDKIPQADLYNISVGFQTNFPFLPSQNTNYTLNMTLSINDTSTNQYPHSAVWKRLFWISLIALCTCFVRW